MTTDTLVPTKIHSLSDLDSLSPRLLTALQEHLDDTTDDCWLWPGARDRHGYSKVLVCTDDGCKTTTTAHRLAYVAMVGPIPVGLTLDHICRTRLCFRPDHLEPVSNRVNQARGQGPVAESVRTRMMTGLCRYGHDAWRRTPGRLNSWKCTECHRDRKFERLAAIREAYQALGLTKREYVSRFGQSGIVAQNILGSLARGVRPEVLIQGAQTAQRAAW